MLDSTEEVERLLSPRRRARCRCSSGSRPSSRPATRCSSTCRSRSTAAARAVPLPDEPQPLERQERVDAARACAACGAISSRARPSRPSAPRRRAPRGCARRCRPPGRRSRRRAPTGAPPTVVLPITVGGATKSTFDEPRGAREERVHRDLDPRREHAADVLAVRRDDVEVRRRAEVDDDARRAVALARRDRVDDPVGPDLARVVVADRDARLHARARRRAAAPAPSARRPAPTRAAAPARSTRGRSRRRPRGRGAPRA